MEERRRNLLALLLVGIAPSVSVIISFGTDGGIVSQVAYGLSKFWMLGLPLFWYLKIDGGSFSWSKPERGNGVLLSTFGEHRVQRASRSAFSRSFSTFSRSFSMFSQVPPSFRKIFEVFGRVRTHSDPFGPIGMHSDAFGSNWKRLDVFKKF